MYIWVLNMLSVFCFVNVVLLKKKKFRNSNIYFNRSFNKRPKGP